MRQSLPAHPTAAVLNGNLYLKITRNCLVFLERHADTRLALNPFHYSSKQCQRCLEIAALGLTTEIEVLGETVSLIIAVAQAGAALERPSLRCQVRSRQSIKQPEDDVILLFLIQTH